MLDPSLNQLLDHVESRYLLVNVAAHRAREIADEAEMRGEILDEKAVKLAIMEIADGKLEAHLRSKYRG